MQLYLLEGIGTVLLKAVEVDAKKNGCTKLWLITLNDNPDAVAFYVKRGFRLIAVHLDAVEISRSLKPEISMIGNHDIPLPDEWELEKKLV